jgi:hypothetical protein
MSRRRNSVVALLMLALAACRNEPVVTEPVAIRYSESGCLGTCPVYTVTTKRDGTVVFIGQHFTAYQGEQELRVSPAVFQRVSAILAPLRPEQGSIPPKGRECNLGDGSARRVTWIGADGAEQTRCMVYPGLKQGRERLDAALDLLPIEPLRRHSEQF